MIRRIHLLNFMSHVDSVVDPAPGLTVLVGPNNCGKSAVVKAIEILAHNDNSTYVTRHGASECSVEIQTRNCGPDCPPDCEEHDHSVLWSRKNSPRYEIDGVLFDRLGKSGTPDSLSGVLRLDRIDVDNRTFDVHVGSQKDPIFLINQPPSAAAQFFASSSNAARLVEMQALHRKRTTERSTERRYLLKEAEQLEREVVALKQVPELEERVAAVEKLFRTIAEQRDNAKTTAATIESLERGLARETRAVAIEACLAELAELPVLEPAVQVRELIRRLDDCQMRLEFATNAETALMPLVSPPVPAETAGLRVLIDRMTEAAWQEELKSGLDTALSVLSEPPAVADTSRLDETIGNLEEREQTVRSATAAEDRARIEFEAIADELNLLIKALGVCPVCGGKLDPTHFLLHEDGDQ